VHKLFVTILISDNLDNLYDKSDISFSQYLLNKAYTTDKSKLIDVIYFSPSNKSFLSENEELGYALTYDMLLLEKDVEFNNTIQLLGISIPTQMFNKDVYPSNTFSPFQLIAGKKSNNYKSSILSTCTNLDCFTNQQRVLFDSIEVEYIPSKEVDVAPYYLHGGYHIKIKLLPFGHTNLLHELEHPSTDTAKAMSLPIFNPTTMEVHTYFSQNNSLCQLNRAKALTLGQINIDDYYNLIIDQMMPVLDQDGLVRDQSVCDMRSRGLTKRVFYYDQMKNHIHKFFSDIQIMANNGDATSQQKLGQFLYESGDISGGVSWMTKSALQGHPIDESYIGDFFLYGIVLPQNDKSAALFYANAAHKFYSTAQEKLATMYLTGTGVISNDSEALKWFKQAAGQNKTESQYRTGLMYHKGQGTNSNLNLAQFWYEKAAEQGHLDAMSDLGQLHITKQNTEIGIKYTRRAADAGLPRAMFNMSITYAHGLGVNKNQDLHIQWLTRAAKAGFMNAQFNLASLYHISSAVPHDYSKAINWYKQAAIQGNKGSIHNLIQIYKNGPTSIADNTQATYWTKILQSSTENEPDPYHLIKE
tara:strand:- start:5253 stop:7010 length:1758 start_codon:yes stop_codon:yes gene_type:complete